MAENAIATTIPNRLYHRLEILANKTNRQIADVLVATAQATLDRVGKMTISPQMWLMNWRRCSNFEIKICGK